MKKMVSLLLAFLTLLTVSGASAAKSKSRPTPTPAPLELGTEPVDPPEEIQRMLDIAMQEWETVNGKDQGVKNKYTKWYNNNPWGRNSWCAGFVTWCMLEAEIPQMSKDDLKKEYEEGVAPGPVFHIRASSPGKMLPGYQYLHRTSLIPQRGFIVLYGYQSNTYIHVGIVYNVELLDDGKYRLTCIEGAMKNTVRMFVYDYDPTSERKNNLTLIPKEERTKEESKIFTYGNHVSQKKWYVTCFMMPWVPGDEDS